jgi:hypothetical protein
VTNTRRDHDVARLMFNLRKRKTVEPGHTIFFMKNDIIFSIWDIAKIYFKKSIYATLKLI